MATKFADRTIEIRTFLDEEYVRRAIKFLEKIRKNEYRIRSEKEYDYEVIIHGLKLNTVEKFKAASDSTAKQVFRIQYCSNREFYNHRLVLNRVEESGKRIFLDRRRASTSREQIKRFFEVLDPYCPNCRGEVGRKCSICDGTGKKKVRALSNRKNSLL